MIDGDGTDVPVETARRQNTRSRLMDAAYEVFAEHGVRAASVEMIAERAAFTRGAFYSNFDSKEELFLALARQKNQERFDRLQSGFDGVLPQIAAATGTLSVSAVEPIVRAFLDVEPDDRKWLLIEGEFRMLAMRDPDIAPRFLAQQNAFVTQFADFIEHTSELVGLRFIIPVEAVARVISALYEGAVQHAILAGHPLYEGPSREETELTLSSTVEALLVPR